LPFDGRAVTANSSAKKGRSALHGRQFRMDFLSSPARLIHAISDRRELPRAVLLHREPRKCFLNNGLVARRGPKAVVIGVVKWVVQRVGVSVPCLR
jgi:hypothetical protein